MSLHRVAYERDFVVDVHSGDGAEWLHPFIGVYGGPLASDYPSALAFAKAFGIPALIRYQMKTQAQIDSGRSLNRQGVAAGKPTILVEIGQKDSYDVISASGKSWNAVRITKAYHPTAAFHSSED